MNMRASWAKALLLCLIGLAAVCRGDASETEKKILESFFQSRVADYHTVFCKEFLAQVEPQKLDKIRDLYKHQVGTLQDVSGASGSYTLAFEKGTAPCQIRLDAQGLVEGLWFSVWVLRDDNPEKILAEFRALPGSASVTIVRD